MSSSAKDIYTEFCKGEISVPLFSQPWWLDAVAGELGWDVVLVCADRGGVKAALPYVKQLRWGIPISGQPPLTQTLGPWLAPSSRKLAKRLSDEKDLMGALIDQLPTFGWFSQNWSPNIQNWLPFYWRGFKQTTRYTYCLHQLDDGDRIWEGLDQKIRTDIRKATRRFGVFIEESDDLSGFFDLNQKVFFRQGKGLPYTFELVQRIDAACHIRGSRKILIARDADGKAHAAAYIVWGAGRAYYLMGGSDPDLRNSGAGSLCLWEAILRSRAHASVFDFEGSMLEPVERFFRAFGAIQTPYFNVSRTTSRLMMLREFAKGVLS